MTTIPPSLVISVTEDQESNSITDLSTPFGLERIQIEYVSLLSSQSHSKSIPPRCNHFCYVVSGTGSLLLSDQNQVPAFLKVDDCFSFPSHVDGSTYTLQTSTEESIGLLTFTDAPTTDAVALVSSRALYK
jgi:uncharacterized cupin superfamily protein